jgi:hypothetical protein
MVSRDVASRRWLGFKGRNFTHGISALIKDDSCPLCHMRPYKAGSGFLSDCICCPLMWDYSFPTVRNKSLLFTSNPSRVRHMGSLEEFWDKYLWYRGTNAGAFENIWVYLFLLLGLTYCSQRLLLHRTDIFIHCFLKYTAQKSLSRLVLIPNSNLS